MDSLVRDPVSPRGAPRTIVEPVVGPPVVLPPQAIAAMASAASRAHLRIAVTPRINRLARCKAHLHAAFPYLRPGRYASARQCQTGAGRVRVELGRDRASSPSTPLRIDV